MMNDILAAVRTVNFAFRTAKIADAVKKLTVAVAAAVCGFIIYRSFRR